MSRIALAELDRAGRFLKACRPESSSRCIVDWCEARDVDPSDFLFYARATTRSCLATIAELGEGPAGQASPAQVEMAIASAVVTGLQVGVDAECRRRDARELPT